VRRAGALSEAEREHVAELVVGAAGGRVPIIVAAGATGWVSGCGVVAPVQSVALFGACLAGSLDQARHIYRHLLPLARLDMEPKLVQYFKAALAETGRYGGPCRPPRLPLTDAEASRVAAAVETLRRLSDAPAHQ
jgi:4-hydroxy-tetrahydrodipicolinate synthase